MAGYKPGSMDWLILFVSPVYCPGLRRRRLFLSNNKQGFRIFFDTCSGPLRYCLLSFRTSIEEDPKQTKGKPVKTGSCFLGVACLPTNNATGIYCTGRPKPAQYKPVLPSQYQ
jgi:hypothetical protein